MIWHLNILSTYSEKSSNKGSYRKTLLSPKQFIIDKASEVLSGLKKKCFWDDHLLKHLRKQRKSYSKGVCSSYMAAKKKKKKPKDTAEINNPQWFIYRAWSVWFWTRYFPGLQQQAWHSTSPVSSSQTTFHSRLPLFSCSISCSKVSNLLHLLLSQTRMSILSH